jgi:hypothetical protein
MSATKPAVEMTDHDAPVWNAAIEAAIKAVSVVEEDDRGASQTYDGGAGQSAYALACRRVEEALRGLIRPELSTAEMDAAGERFATAIRRAHLAQVALHPFVDAYVKAADPIGDSDLYDEQPRHVAVTLGDCRRAAAALAPAKQEG